MSRWSKSSTLSTLSSFADEWSTLRISFGGFSLALTLSWKTVTGFSRDSSSYSFCKPFPVNLTQTLMLSAAVFTDLLYVIFYLVLGYWWKKCYHPHIHIEGSTLNWHCHHLASFITCTDFSLLCSATKCWPKWTLVPFPFQYPVILWHRETNFYCTCAMLHNLSQNNCLT